MPFPTGDVIADRLVLLYVSETRISIFNVPKAACMSYMYAVNPSCAHHSLNTSREPNKAIKNLPNLHS